MNKLFDSNLEKQIKEYLSPMKNPIQMVLFTKKEPCIMYLETTQLLKEIAKLSPKIDLVEKDLEIDHLLAEKYDVTMAPSFVILDSQGHYRGVKFNGIPAGHEINSFLSAIMDMSGLDYGFTDSIKSRIQKINKPVNIKVFVTLSCPHCPGAVQNAHRLAMLNQNIEGEMIEAQTFQELSNQYQVSGVPKIVINGKHELLGNQPIEQYLKILESL